MSFDHDILAATQAFSKNLHVLAEQKKSQLFDSVRVENMTTQSQFFDRIGEIEMTPRNSRHQDTAYTPLPFSRRRVEIKDYEVGEIIDKIEDVQKSMVDPQSATTEAFLRAGNRNLDKIIINEGLLGSAAASDSEFSITNIARPSPIVDGGTNLPTSKIKDAIERMGSADVDVAEDKPCLVITYSQYRSLLEQNEFINKDFKTGASQELVVSTLANFLGINIKIVSTKILPIVANIRTCVLFTKSSLILGIQNKFMIDAGKDYSKGGSVRVIGKQNIGAVRMEENRVVPINCDESAT